MALSSRIIGIPVTDVLYSRFVICTEQLSNASIALRSHLPIPDESIDTGKLREELCDILNKWRELGRNGKGKIVVISDPSFIERLISVLQGPTPLDLLPQSIFNGLACMSLEMSAVIGADFDEE